METEYDREFDTFNFSSYRTYEEWKLADPGLSRINSNSSYRTYEEWKRGGATGAQAISVWFLPYL